VYCTLTYITATERQNHLILDSRRLAWCSRQKITVLRQWQQYQNDLNERKCCLIIYVEANDGLMECRNTGWFNVSKGAQQGCIHSSTYNSVHPTTFLKICSYIIFLYVCVKSLLISGKKSTVKSPLFV